VIESDLPRERPLDIRETPEFLKIAHRVREGLRRGMPMREHDTLPKPHQLVIPVWRASQDRAAC
jgi:hypothetical protein